MLETKNKKNNKGNITNQNKINIKSKHKLKLGIKN